MQTTTTRRIDVDSASVGFTPPPCPVNLRLRPQGSAWEVTVLMEPNKAASVSRWLQPFLPSAIVVAPGLAPKSLRATFASLPPAWSELVLAIRLHHVVLLPNGTASLFVEGSQADVEALTARLQEAARPVRARAAPLDGHPRLTPRQLDVLSTAVALGYYEIPHRLDLRALAATMGISLGAVSELLRRAEALVLTSFIDSLMAAQWRPVEGAAHYLRGPAARPANGADRRPALDA